jgi:hypothetical protein
MNLALQAGINQIRGQTENLIQSEMQDKNAGQKEKENNQNQPNQDNKENQPNQENQENQPKENIEINNNKPKPVKKKRKVIIDKALSIRMYSILLLHTSIITILLFIIHYKSYNIEAQTEELGLGAYSWFIFGGCIILSIIVSILVSKIKFLSKLFLNYIFYLVLLALNALAFVWGGKDDLFDYIMSMLIMFDAASLVILIFASLIKDPPSTFWLMCSCAAGDMLAMFILIKVYEENKYYVLISSIISFFIYEIMNYKAFDNYTSNKNNNSIPSMMSLPFELNLSFVRLIYYILYCIYFVFKSCCCASSDKK